MLWESTATNEWATYGYNGLGDRIWQDSSQQGASHTEYTLDLNAGLTQVLSDGTNNYTYGLGRISQTGVDTEYFLGDALGSVRQLTNGSGDVTLAKSYTPFGEVLSSNGSGVSPFAYTGEATDANGMVYLRSRYYNPAMGRFMNRDTFPGFLGLSQSQNRFVYTENNPIRYVDPTGHYGWDDFIAEGKSLINNPVGHILDQIQKNRNMPWECTDVGQIALWAAPALAPLMIVAAIPIILVSPDSIIDLAFMAHDLYRGDSRAFALDAMGLMIPGVTGLGLLSKVDDVYDAARLINKTDNSVKLNLIQNKYIDLYHGASLRGAENIRNIGINLKYTNPPVDFGIAFYTTTNFKQAVQWAQRNADGGTVLHFRVLKSDLAILKGYTFNGTSLSWHKFILNNRLQQPLPIKFINYDFISGPMMRYPDDYFKYIGATEDYATGKMTNSVESYLEGIELLMASGQQTAFYSQASFDILKKSLLP